MKKSTRIAAALLALLTTLSFGLVVGCGGGEDSSSTSSIESSSQESSDSSSSEPSAPECTDKEKGHEYSETTGLCIRCNQAPVFPDITKASFPLAEPCNHAKPCGFCDYLGAGEEYDRFELVEGCYTVTLPNDLTLNGACQHGSGCSYCTGEIWLSFSVKSAGQYVLYTVDGNQGVSLTRHNANAHNSNVRSPIAAIVEGENSYSYVNCGQSYFNQEWRATFRLTGVRDTQVKICFAKIGEPAWEPAVIRTKVYPTQINGVKAKDQADDMQLVDVPYNTKYFYSDPAKGGDGYYHMGTESNPGEIIYVAINTEAKRLFSDNKFTTILKDSGTALNLSNGLTADGNYNILCYTPFIMNWKDENAGWSTRPDEDGNTPKPPEADLTKNAYQNYCNRDGVYPVNEELHTFLTLYLQNNRPADTEISVEDWQAQEDWLWLSACYYYELIPVGTKDNPFKLHEGTQTVVLPSLLDTNLAGYLYCTVEGEGEYQITCSDTFVRITVNSSSEQSPFISTVTAGESFMLSNLNFETVETTTTITVTKKTT